MPLDSMFVKARFQNDYIMILIKAPFTSSFKIKMGKCCIITTYWLWKIWMHRLGRISLLMVSRQTLVPSCTLFLPIAIKKKVTLTLFKYKDLHKIIWISSEHGLNTSQLSWSVEHFAERLYRLLWYRHVQ